MTTKFKALFAYLERKSKIDLRYFAKGGAWLSGSQFLLSLLAIVSATAFSRFLDPQIFGQYRFILSLVGIFSLTTLTGMTTALIRSMARGYGKTFMPILKTKISWGLLGFLSALIAAGYYFYRGNELLAGALLISSFFIPFKDSLNIYSVILQVHKRFDKLAFYKVLTQTISVATLVATIILTDNLFYIILAYFAPITIIRLLILRKTLRTYSLTGDADPKAKRYGYHLSFLKGISLATGHVQNIMLFHFLGPVSVAIFYFALAPVEQVRGLIAQLNTLLIPKAAQDNWSIGSIKSFGQKITPFIFILSLGVTVYILTAPLIFKVLFPTYTNAVFYSRLLSPAIILTAINTVLTSIIKAKGMKKALYTLTMTGSVSQILLAVSLIYYFGIPGLITAIYISKLLQILVGGAFLFLPQIQSNKIR